MTTAPRPAGLWWVYALVAASLAATGAGVGEALFAANDLGNVEATARCMASEGISPNDSPASLYFAKNLFDACMETSSRLSALTSLAGVFGLVISAWLLMVTGGLAIRWRLRSARLADVPEEAKAALEKRFAALCEGDKRRPRLVVAPPLTGVREAFTTAVPGRPAWVVVPLALAYKPPATFDAVAVHELGHVRARDVMWASAVWWSGWLAVPALVIALFPLLSSPGALWTLHGLSLVAAVVSAIATIILRASLLRHRESVADAHVAQVLADPAAPAAYLGTKTPAATHRLTSIVRGWFATHPRAADRDGSVPNPGHGGFFFSAAVGMVAMRLYHSLDEVLSNLVPTVQDFVRLPESIALIVASLLWAAVMVPAWTRRAAAPTRWAGPWAGAVLGLVAGYCVKPPGTAQVVVAAYRHHIPLLVGVLAVGILAAVVLAAGVVARLARSERRRLGGLGAVVATAAALTAMVGAATSLAGIFVYRQVDSALIRGNLMAGGTVSGWGVLVVLILGGLVLVALGTRRQGIGRLGVVVVAVAGIVGGVGASLSWLLRPHRDLPREVSAVMVYERWWICALAGLAAAFAVALAARRRDQAALPTLPVAVLSGLSAAALAGAVQCLVIAIDGGRLNVFEQSLWTPGWLLVLALTYTMPLALLVSRVPARRDQVRRPVARWAIGAGGVTIALTVSLLTGTLSWGTVADHDYDRAIAELAANEIPSPPAVPDSGRDHSRLLDSPGATDALSPVLSLLPRTAVGSDRGPSSDVTVSPDSCEQALDRSAAREDSEGKVAVVGRDYAFPVMEKVFPAQVTVSVTSFRTSWDYLSDLEEVARTCSNYRLPDEVYDGGFMDCTWHVERLADTPYSVSRGHITRVGTISGNRVEDVITTYTALVGHNVVEVALVESHGKTPPSDAVAERLDQLLADTLRAVVASI
ncbi:M48 family metalloprotease [Actinokineospora globicatena]|uniref:M48 family metalloprotease n=1 Tax=Actinokineospora globicatena TaxID=103729 RepID=UPI0020A42BB1|nr:M48 family metalloprotease [Actinokineospora globicatena]MCP2303025.1 Zn-dependent protease with chaperone function [Actinokineospora globicatena]GLW79866.1 hypothetical protein Aglo01_43470 [Actinokineospora globicatena]GLW85724.1 hypothetical protein Aglo02_33640 [Actinokineospora globicatena]